MKRTFLFNFLLLISIIMLFSCERDKINIISSEEIVTDDDFAYDDFTKTVTIEYSTSASATVTGTDDDFSVEINGNGVTIAYNGNESVLFDISGITTNGYLKIYNANKQALVLNSVTIGNNNGAAINLQGSKSDPATGGASYIVMKGTNILSDGSSYTTTPSTEDEKAAIFSEGNLIFTGTGSLTVNAKGKSGIISDANVQINSGTITASSSAGHGIRGADAVMISNGTLTISTSAATKKGISSDGNIQINGGTITITVSGDAAYDNDSQDYSGTAGIKTKGNFTINGGNLTITNSGKGGKGISGDALGYFNGGNVTVQTTGANYTTGDVSSKAVKFKGNLQFSGSEVYASSSADEGIESKGTIDISNGVIYSYSAKDDAINSAGDFTISGGVVCAHSAGNDGIDANGNCYIKGGFVYAIGAKSPEVAIDANTEGGYKLYVQGGTIVAIGGLENNSSLSQNCYSTSSWSKNAWYGITVGNNTYAFKTPSNGGTALVVSGSSQPSLKSSVTISGGTEICNGMLNLTGTVSGGSSVSLSSYTGGGSGPGGW